MRRCEVQVLVSPDIGRKKGSKIPDMVAHGDLPACRGAGVPNAAHSRVTAKGRAHALA